MKITLKQLADLFSQYAADESNPKNMRQFAAQCIVMAAHIERKSKQADAQIAELAAHVLKLQQAGAVSPQPTVTQSPAVPAAAPEAPSSEEDEAEAMAAKVRQETEAEAAAITVIPPPKTNGQAEAAS